MSIEFYWISFTIKFIPFFLYCSSISSFEYPIPLLLLSLTDKSNLHFGKQTVDRNRNKKVNKKENIYLLIAFYSSLNKNPLKMNCGTMITDHHHLYRMIFMHHGIHFSVIAQSFCDGHDNDTQQTKDALKIKKNVISSNGLIAAHSLCVRTQNAYEFVLDEKWRNRIAPLYIENEIRSRKKIQISRISHIFFLQRINLLLKRTINGFSWHNIQEQKNKLGNCFWISLEIFSHFVKY